MIYLGKKAVRALSRDLLGPARPVVYPAPARALTPRPRWKLTRPSPVPPDTARQPNSEPTAAEPTQAIPSRRSTFLARREPLLVSPVGVAFVRSGGSREEKESRSTGVLIYQRPLKEDLFPTTFVRQLFLAAFDMVLQLGGFCVVGVGGVVLDAEVGDGLGPWLGQGLLPMKEERL